MRKLDKRDLPQAKQEIAAVEKALLRGYPQRGSRSQPSASSAAAKALGIPHPTLCSRLYSYERIFKLKPRWDLYVAAPVETRDIKDEREILKLKDKITELQSALKASHRAAVNEDAVKAMLGVVASTPTSPPDWLLNPKTKKQKITPEVPMTIWSDWHAGDVVDAAEVNFTNSYDLATFRERVRNLVRNTLHLCDHHHSGVYEGFVLNILGDLVSGGIHPELKRTDEVPVLGQVLEVRDILVWAIRILVDRFKRLYIPWSCGNHGRQTVKPEYKEYTWQNYDWLIGELLVREFANDKRIRFDITKSNDVFYQVYGLRFLATHGDMLGTKGGDGIIGALGPIMRGELKTSRQSAAYGRDYDVLLAGHWHQELWLPRAIIANALKGFDQYAHKVLRASPTTPSQPLWFVHPSKGITARWNVLVEDQAVRATEWVTWQKAA